MGKNERAIAGQYVCVGANQHGAVACRETAQEAEDREMRRVINFQSNWGAKEKEVSERHERRERADKRRRVSRRECEARKAANMETFLMRNAWSIILAAVVAFLDIFGLVNFWLCMAVMFLIGVYLVVNFYAYVTRNHGAAKREDKYVCAKHC